MGFMKKAKNIIKKIGARLVKSLKKLGNVHVLSRLILSIAAVMAIIAVCVVIFSKPAREAVMEVVNPEHHTVVEVKSGDSLSRILSAQGFSINDINAISKNLKKDYVLKVWWLTIVLH